MQPSGALIWSGKGSLAMSYELKMKLLMHLVCIVQWGVFALIHWEMLGKGKEETFVCVCGYKEKLSSFQARRTKEGAGVNKRDVQKYLKKQQKEAAEPVNNAFAQALSGIKLD